MPDATSVGAIGLDLEVNKKKFDKQMNAITSLAKKAGAALAGAFAVTKLVSFGKQCLELGSDLAEVQNVVDVTFPAMAGQVETFAKSAAKSYGLSEIMAKRYVGTFGSMAKAFGFTESQAYDMGSALTALTGDVASFYNLSQDVAYTKLKSVFTGETESLKDLGVVMTQTALDSFALANGFGKTTANMTEAEKVALRYQFVSKQLAAAQGDFARTSGGWANQVRILSLQFDSLKATIGQGLINLFLPVLRIINTLIGRLMTLANAFRSFTELITGQKAGGAAEELTDTAIAAASAADAVEGVGDAAKSAAKKSKRLADFDRLKTLEDVSSSGGSGGGASGAPIDFGTLDTGPLAEAEEKTEGIKKGWREISDIFKSGFGKGLGDLKALDSIKTSTVSIKDSLLKIFRDGKVAEAAKECGKSILYALGETAGATVSIGLSLADNLTGGIAQYLSGNTERIRDFLVSMFDITGKVAQIQGDLCSAVARVFEAFQSDGAKTLTASFIGILTDAFMGSKLLSGKLAADLMDTITAPFVNNSDGIRIALEDTFSAIAPIIEGTKEIVTALFDTMNQSYDEHVAPMFEVFKEGLTRIGDKALELYEQYILPVVKNISSQFTEFKNKYLIPLTQTFGEFASKTADAIKTLWTQALEPYIKDMMEVWAPILAEVLQKAWELFQDFARIAAVTIDGVLKVLGALMDFITGVFSGDWEKAWQGIKDFFKGIWDAMNEINKASGKLLLDGFKDIINVALIALEKLGNSFIDCINGMIDGLNHIHVDIPDWVPGLGGKSFGISIPSVGKLQLPRLAQGGYVKPNTPQLAMIGDNRHQGEVVAPEGKLYEISVKAMKDTIKEFMSTLMPLLTAGKNQGQNIVIKVSGEMAPFIRLLKAELDKEQSRTGINFEVVYE